MKGQISLTDTDHDFHKVNLMTMAGGYDVYRCKCELEGKRSSLSPILNVTGKAELFIKCPNAQPKEPVIFKRVRITNFKGNSPAFANLINGTEHDVVDCPKQYVNKYGSDVCVMGVGEPIRLLGSEYEKI